MNRRRLPNRRASETLSIECARECCGALLPRFRNGRQLSKKARFCSSRCQQRAAKIEEMASGEDPGWVSANSLQKCPSNRPSCRDLGGPSITAGRANDTREMAP
jgi:hypothetical protein